MNRPFPHGYVCGEISKARKVDGLVLIEASYKPGQQIPNHCHDHARVVFVLRGSFTEIYEKKVRTCTPSTLIFRPPAELHAETFHNRGAICLVVDIEPAWMERTRERSVVLDCSADFRGGLIGHLARRLHGEFNQRDDAAPLAIEAIMLGIIAEAARRQAKAVASKPPRWLEQARELLHAQFAGRLTLSNVAASVGVHPVHLARTFRQCYGCTMGEYIRQLRIDFACRQMTVSEAPLSQIALAAGFFDQGHFTRNFKHHTGMTPAEYRTLCRSR
jgi:AraC family transcriptional regulator